MSQLDEQLASAAKRAPRTDNSANSTPREQQPPKRHVGMFIALSIAAIGLMGLVAFGFKDAAVYAKTVDQVLSSKQSLVGKRLRVEGKLVHGTLKKRDTPCEYRFQLHSNSGENLPVRYPKCVIPDTFQDRPETEVKVTAEGILTKQGYFEASLIMAKCPSKYEKRDGKTVPVGDY